MGTIAEMRSVLQFKAVGMANVNAETLYGAQLGTGWPIPESLQSS